MSASSSRRRSFARARMPRAESSRQLLRNWVSLLASLAVIAAGFASFGSGPASAATSTVVVGNGVLFPNGLWALENATGTSLFVNGPAGQPGGVGSLAMGVSAPSQHETLSDYEYGQCSTGLPACSNTNFLTWTL